MHHMKTKLLSFLLLTGATAGALAVLVQDFTDWESIIAKSPDIVIAQCISPFRNARRYPDGMLWADIDVLNVLKGDTKPGKLQLVTQHSPQQGWRYLIVGTYHTNAPYTIDWALNATEDWRVIPLSPFFPDHVLDGKSLKTQIRIIFEHRLQEVTQELKRGEEEKRRLEKALAIQ